MVRRLGAPVLRALGTAALVGLVALAAGLFGPDAPAARRWAFVDDAVPPDLTARAGPWTIEHHPSATGARALVSPESEGPAVLLASELRLRDFRASTRCKDDCGIVFRHRDDAHYEIARVDVASQRAVLASVSGGQEHVLASAPADTPPGTWHQLAVDASAGTLRVTLDGRLLISASEGVYATGGAVGLWAPPATTYFDELSIAALTDAPRTLEVLPFFARPRG